MIDFTQYFNEDTEDNKRSMPQKNPIDMLKEILDEALGSMGADSPESLASKASQRFEEIHGSSEKYQDEKVQAVARDIASDSASAIIRQVGLQREKTHVTIPVLGALLSGVEILKYDLEQRNPHSMRNVYVEAAEVGQKFLNFIKEESDKVDTVLEEFALVIGLMSATMFHLSHLTEILEHSRIMQDLEKE